LVMRGCRLIIQRRRIAAEQDPTALANSVFQSLYHGLPIGLEMPLNSSNGEV